MTPALRRLRREDKDSYSYQLCGEFQASLEDTVRLKMNRRKEEIKGRESEDFRGRQDRYLMGTNLNCPTKAEM